MKIAQKITWLLMFLLVTACSTTSTTMVVDPNASAQVKINETQVMLLLGGSDGKGLLEMKDGEVHAFKIAGVKLGGMGIDKIHLTGNVYNLKKVADFAGIYFEADAAVTVVKGAGGTWMKNDKGVSIHLSGSSDGLSLGLGVEGVEITLL